MCPDLAALNSPGITHQRVRAELHRVEELVVAPPVDDIDALIALGGLDADFVAMTCRWPRRAERPSAGRGRSA
jgi:hypothetical protein